MKMTFYFENDFKTGKINSEMDLSHQKTYKTWYYMRI